MNHAIAMAGCLGTAAICIWLLITSLKSGEIVDEFGNAYTRAKKPIRFWTMITLLAASAAGSFYLMASLI